MSHDPYLISSVYVQPSLESKVFSLERLYSSSLVEVSKFLSLRTISPWQIGTLKYLEIKIEEWPSRAKWGQSGPNRAKWCQMMPNRVKRGKTGSNGAKQGQKAPYRVKLGQK